jgi:hypothetical protein
MPWADLKNGNADYRYLTNVDQYIILKATGNEDSSTEK